MSKKRNDKSVSEDLIDFMLEDDAQGKGGGRPAVEDQTNTYDPDVDSVRIDQASASGDDDRTAVLPPDNDDYGSSKPADATQRIDDSDETDHSAETKVSYGVPSSRMPDKTVAPSSMSGGGAVYTSAEATLKQSEHLRVAQARVNELEEEVERLRRQNEQLAAAGETFQRLKDEYYSKVEALQNDKVETGKRHDDESRLARERLGAKERENLALKQKIEELEMRLETNIRKIRKREKDLEHRLEIAKIEEIALVRSKDELILELKRKIDRLKIESENYNRKSQEIYKQLNEKQEVIKRVVRALRIALSQLEGEDESIVPLKKVE